MGEVISTFHIDVRLLIAQAVNFAIVFVILYYFGIKPLMKILTERSKKIEDSLKNATKIEKELQQTESKRAEVIKKAKVSAKVFKWLAGKKIKQIIFVKDRIINFVV